jgi:hypothetical protein
MHSCEWEHLPSLKFVPQKAVEYVSAHALHNVETHGANRDAAASVAEVLFAMVGSLGYSASQRRSDTEKVCTLSSKYIDLWSCLSISRYFCCAPVARYELRWIC